MEHKNKQMTCYRISRRGLNNFGKQKDRTKSRQQKKGRRRQNG